MLLVYDCDNTVVHYYVTSKFFLHFPPAQLSVVSLLSWDPGRLLWVGRIWQTAVGSRVKDCNNSSTQIVNIYNPRP